MNTIANSRRLANTANRAVMGMAPKFRGRDHANLGWQIKCFITSDNLEMRNGARWDNTSVRIRHLVGGVTMYTWTQSHLNGVPQPLLVCSFLQE